MMLGGVTRMFTARLRRLLAFECFRLGPIDAIESIYKESVERRQADTPAKRRQVSALILRVSSMGAG